MSTTTRTTTNNERPPTPPSRLPRDDEWRFKSITLACEWLEDYRPGCYHPVHLGDIFNDGQYKVLRKLGEGSFSTVWLVRDLRNNTYAALKILVAEITESTNELKILHHITDMAPVDGTQYVTKLLGEFEHHGPNGIHKCLVFEPMGPSVNFMVETLPQFKVYKQGMKIRYPPQTAKNILKQSLQALEILHHHGIAHGDFQPGNMLFALTGLDSTPEHELQQLEDVQSESISEPVERLDGKIDEWAPRYLCVAQPLASFTRPLENLRIKLSDMGGAYFFTQPPKKIVTPVGLRAPEQIFSNDINRTLDIWSFGCLLFELMTGDQLFCVYGPRFMDDKHLLLLSARIGPLPNDLLRHWTNYSLYFTPEGQLFNCQLGGVAEGAKPLMLEQTTMEDEFDRAKPEIDEHEAGQIKALLRRILQFDPAKRPTAHEILQDPWFKD